MLEFLSNPASTTGDDHDLIKNIMSCTIYKAVLLLEVCTFLVLCTECGLFHFAMLSQSVARLSRRLSPSCAPPWRLYCSTPSVADQAIEFVIERGYEPNVAKGVVAALSAPGSGVPASAALTMVKTMAGRWEVGEDNGLEAHTRSQ